MRGVRETGLFDDGESVHVRADEECGAGTILEDRDDAEGRRAVRVTADVVGYGVTCGPEIVGKDG